LLRGNKEKKSQSLLDLFNAIQEDIKKKIMTSENKEEFKRNLANVSNYFEEFRYLYELSPSSIEYKFLCDFF
jgi:hypothetical protein